MKTIPIILAFVLAVTPSIVFAQSPQITVLTDKQSYVTGDTITISGKVLSLGASNSAVLQVFNPFNVLVQIGTINLAPDGTFSKTIKAEGESWANDGSYQIKILYVSTPILATVTANVNFKEVQSTPTPSQTTQPSQSQPSTQSPSTTQPSTSQSPVQTTQNPPQTPDDQTSVEDQIKQRIALANKLKQQIENTATIQIPFWVKDTAQKWHDGTVDNAGFSKDIQYLITSGLVKVSGQVTPTTTFEYIPSWQKKVADWWSQGLISDYDYVNSIQYMLDKKIIK